MPVAEEPVRETSELATQGEMYFYAFFSCLLLLFSARPQIPFTETTGDTWLHHGGFALSTV